MKHRSIVSLSFALCIALLSVASCGEDDTQTPTKNTDAITHETSVQENADTGSHAEDLGDYDFGGYEFRIVAYDEYPADFNEPSANMIDNSIYERNTHVEEVLNIKFVETRYPYAQYNDVNTLLRNAGLAQSDDYDLYTVVHRQAHSAVLEGYVPAASNMPSVDLEQPWYLQELNKSLTINDIMLLAYTAYDKNPGGYAVFFNKKIISELDLDNPYQLVDDGIWTSERLYTMAEEAISDIDGNGKMELGDRFGIITEQDNLIDLAYRGSGERLVNFSVDPPAVNTSERLVDVCSMILPYTKIKGFIFNPFSEFGQTEDSRYRGNEEFAADRALFLVRGTDTLTALGNMESDYGIVPFPKYDEAQDRYYVGIDGSRIAVPLGCSADLSRVCIVKEALAIESLRYTYPAYYENALKNRYVRDEESIRMLEIITESNAFDLGASIWSDIVREPWMTNIVSGKDNFISAIQKKEKQANKAIGELLEQVDTLSELTTE